MNKVRLFAVFVFVAMMIGLVSARPAGATGPIVQFDANALALQNGDLVAAWGGQTASGTPTFLTNQTPNGMPAVQFDGGGDRMGDNVAVPASAAGDWILVAVIKPQNIGAYHNLADDDPSGRPMLWIDPNSNYELNFSGGTGSKIAGAGTDGWDIVIADSRLNQLYVNSPTPNASGGSGILYNATKNYDFFHRDGLQTFQGLVAEMRIYTDRADFGGDFAALYSEMVTRYFGDVVAVTLQEGTATYSQSYACCALPVDQAVDGIIVYGVGNIGNLNGWGIHPAVGQNQIAVWETSSDIDATELDFNLYQLWGAAHNLGRFRISYTTDDRSTFADGLNSGGDVTADWTVLTGAILSSTGGETFTVLGDNSILVSGNNPDTTMYSVSFSGSFSGITGIRLEAMADASLPYSGPGRQANGNFTLTEITLHAIAVTDSDGDGVPDDEDDFPNDPDRAVSCLAGYYGAFECTPAPLGKFVAADGALTADLCPMGRFSDQLASTACTPAPAGSFVAFAGAAQATKCALGTYQDLEGQTSCTLAPAGSFVDFAGAAGATQCALGTYQDLEGQTSCTEAPIGFYVPDAGSAAATICPAGSTTASTASTSLSDCNYAPTADAGGPYLVAVGQDVTFNGSLSSDPEGDSLTEFWAADGGTVAGDVYTAGAVPGIYAVELVVNDELSDSQLAETIVVVYDPSGGFVTGGGWIDSPVNADYEYMQVGGKASFGFVAKYKKGATAPDGNTQFQFKAGDLNFHSASYEWLVVAGNKAQFKGEGAVNGEEGYTFMIFADDDNPDTFRIKIWDDTETVYDNGSQQSLGGGSIKVHN